MEVSVDEAGVTDEPSEVEWSETLPIREVGDMSKVDKEQGERNRPTPDKAQAQAQAQAQVDNKSREDRDGWSKGTREEEMEQEREGGGEGGDMTGEIKKEGGAKEEMTCRGAETEEVGERAEGGDLDTGREDKREAEEREAGEWQAGLDGKEEKEWEEWAEGKRLRESSGEGDMEEGKAREREKRVMAQDPETAHLDPASPKKRSKDRLSPSDAQKQVRRLTPDFPDSLYELLCSMQEGRRLNDQRCSFRMERRCQSEPSTPVLRLRVVFSSMTSLQREEFFELVATSQGRRLDDQRARLQELLPPVLSPRPEANEHKGSQERAESEAVAPKPAPKEDLYNMILTSQAQGRLENQRSAPPGPVDDEDFFSLLLRVQGGRMDEQRTELPVAFRP